jgi:hypothetical protein
VPLLGKAEKEQLEALILEKLTEHYDRRGSDALLRAGIRVVVHGEGVLIDTGEHGNPLAAVPVHTLFTAMCYLDGETAAVPREALASLASEASNAAAAQINRIAPA